MPSGSLLGLAVAAVSNWHFEPLAATVADIRIGAVVDAVRAVPWTPLAFGAYLVNVTIGSRAMLGRRMGRVWHHRWFVLTSIFTAIAAVLSFPAHPWRGALLLLALLPLVLLPSLTAPVSQHPARHALLAASALPGYVTALVLWVAAVML